MISRKAKRIIKHRRVRARVKGTAERPRLSVFRSNRHIYAQVVDDTQGKTLAHLNDAVLDESKSKRKRSPKTDKARLIGKILGETLLKKGVKEIVFDRGGYKYHGQVKALAEGLRETGVKF